MTTKISPKYFGLSQTILPRLDIVDMVLAQPESTDSKCDFDQFIITGGSPIPAICGINTGLHSKYIERPGQTLTLRTVESRA